MEKFDKNKSVLPKWLIERGLQDRYGIIQSRPELEEIFEHFTQKYLKNNKEFDRVMAERFAWDLLDFRIMFFDAHDVEKAFREILQK